MKRTRSHLTLLLLLIIGCCNAQTTNPNFNDAFLQTEVAIVKIQTSEENLEFILDQNNWGQDEVSATFIYQSSVFTDTLENIGFRLRGNTSLMADKKSFKVSFNAFQPGNKWKGLKKLNLNGEHNDVSLMRSKLGWDLLRDYGLPASRTSFVRLYVNDEYKGLYLNTEHIDQEFTSKRFTEGNGNLYKCTWPAHLQYEGNDAEDYISDAYELKTNEWNSEVYEDLAEFITVLNQTSDEELECALTEQLNVRDYVKSLAAEVLLGHWDGYSVNNNNYYLYSNLAEKRFEWIHYDLDNTLGIDWLGSSWSDRDIYNWGSNWDERPLSERVLENDTWRNMYSYEINYLLQNHFNYDVMSANVTQWQNLIGEFVEQDTYYTQDYGFNYSDFQEAGTEAWGEHVAEGILEYVENRVNSAADQLEDFSAPQGIFYADEIYPVFGENVIGVYFRTDANTNPSATLHYSIDGLANNEVIFEDYSDGFFYAEVPFSETNVSLTYIISFTDGSYAIDYPCQPKTIPLNEQNNGLLINELMASNSITIPDEEGDFEDWIELYNSNDFPIYIGNYYITDNLDYPNKWKLPNITMEAHSHRLIWTDNDPEDGPLHSNFNLNSSGDQVLIYAEYEDGYQLLDHVEFVEQFSDESYGRESDGAENWISFNNSTPNAPNGVVSISEQETPFLTAYPNPTSNTLHFNSDQNWKLYSTSGQYINQGYGRVIDLSAQTSGIYIIRTDQAVISVTKL